LRSRGNFPSKISHPKKTFKILSLKKIHFQTKFSIFPHTTKNFLQFLI
jgi:hypothetical protein